MSAQITHDEWLAALEAAQAQRPQDDEGMTAREIAVVFGCSDKKCLELLRKIQDAGRLAVGRRNMIRLDGKPQCVPVYRITEA
jgi:MarR-like DNA-binding transcriptional regulator SgrR of sgrS sRNA